MHLLALVCLIDTPPLCPYIIVISDRIRHTLFNITATIQILLQSHNLQVFGGDAILKKPVGKSGYALRKNHRTIFVNDVEIAIVGIRTTPS